jgi:hypothetical protein
MGFTGQERLATERRNSALTGVLEKKTVMADFGQTENAISRPTR